MALVWPSDYANGEPLARPDEADSPVRLAGIEGWAAPRVSFKVVS
jgi:hypothetical protein